MVFLYKKDRVIDNPNNVEINSMIRLVVSGMFLLSHSGSPMSFSSF